MLNRHAPWWTLRRIRTIFAYSASTCASQSARISESSLPADSSTSLRVASRNQSSAGERLIDLFFTRCQAAAPTARPTRTLIAIHVRQWHGSSRAGCETPSRPALRRCPPSLDRAAAPHIVNGPNSGPVCPVRARLFQYETVPIVKWATAAVIMYSPIPGAPDHCGAVSGKRSFVGRRRSVAHQASLPTQMCPSTPS